MSRTPDLAEDEKLTVAVETDHQGRLHRPRPNDFITRHSASELTSLTDINTDPKNKMSTSGYFLQSEPISQGLQQSMTEGFFNMNKMIQSSLEAFTSQVANTLASNLNQNMPVSVPRISHGGENPNGSSRQIPCNQGASGENKGKRSLSCNQEDFPLLPQKKKIKIRVVPPPSSVSNSSDDEAANDNSEDFQEGDRVSLHADSDIDNDINNLINTVNTCSEQSQTDVLGTVTGELEPETQLSEPVSDDLASTINKIFSMPSQKDKLITRLNSCLPPSNTDTMTLKKCNEEIWGSNQNFMPQIRSNDIKLETVQQMST